MNFTVCKLCLSNFDSPQKNKKTMFREFPGSPAVRSLHFTAEGLGSIPGRVTKIPHAFEAASGVEAQCIRAGLGEKGGKREK